MYKKKSVRLSDLITDLRIVLSIILTILLIYFPYVFNFWFYAIFILIVILLDALDGFIARRYDEVLVEGGFYDIVGDRITEILFQIPFIYHKILDPSVLIYFVVKDFLIDYARTITFFKTKKAPFDQLQNKISRFLVKGRFMRFLIGLFKILMFESLVFALFNPSSASVANVIAYVTVIISVFRSLPPLIEFYFLRK